MGMSPSIARFLLQIARNPGDRRADPGEADELLAPPPSGKPFGAHNMAHGGGRPREDADRPFGKPARHGRRGLSDREIDEGAFELSHPRHFHKRIALRDLDIVETGALETTLGFDGEGAEALDRDHRAREMADDGGRVARTRSD